MENTKLSVNVELEGVIAQYFRDVKAKTGLNNANVVRYCVFEMWKREVGDAPNGR